MPSASPLRLPIGGAAQALTQASADKLQPAVGVRPRQCGRCRMMFEGDPTLCPTALPEWWLCPPCRLALFGDRHRRPAAAHSSTGTHRAR
jgi:hypothetical protein